MCFFLPFICIPMSMFSLFNSHFVSGQTVCGVRLQFRAAHARSLSENTNRKVTMREFEFSGRSTCRVRWLFLSSLYILIWLYITSLIINKLLKCSLCVFEMKHVTINSSLSRWYFSNFLLWLCLWLSYSLMYMTSFVSFISFTVISIILTKPSSPPKDFWYTDIWHPWDTPNKLPLVLQKLTRVADRRCSWCHVRSARSPVSIWPVFVCLVTGHSNMYALAGEPRELCDRGPLLLQKQTLQPHNLAASKCHTDYMRLLHREVPKWQDHKQEQTLVGPNKMQIIQSNFYVYSAQWCVK